MSTNAQSVNYMFTAYHPIKEDPTIPDMIEFLETFKKEDFRSLCKYFIGQIERCPRTGRLHVQAYAIFHKRYTVKGLKTAVNKSWHWEIRIGSHDHAKTYCSKPEHKHGIVTGTERVTFGVEPTQGKRNDLDKIGTALREGATMKDVAAANMQKFVQYGKALDNYRQLYIYI